MTTKEKRLAFTGVGLIVFAFALAHIVRKSSDRMVEEENQQNGVSNVASAQEVWDNQARAERAKGSAKGRASSTNEQWPGPKEEAVSPTGSSDAGGDEGGAVAPAMPVSLPVVDGERERLKQDLVFRFYFMGEGSTSSEIDHGREGYALWSIANSGQEEIEDLIVEVQADEGITILDNLTDAQSESSRRAVWKIPILIPGTPDILTGLTGMKGGRLQFRVDAPSGEKRHIGATVTCHNVRLTVQPPLTVYVR